MKIRRLLTLGWLARRLLAELSGLRSAVESQNLLLARLADSLAPQPPATSEAQVGSVDTFDPLEQMLIADFIDRTRVDTGHEPDDEEILTYLADEKTVDLHVRLKERESEMARLAERRVVARGSVR